MITLQDSIEINTTPEKILNWFQNLDKHFTDWHPNHTKFEKITGGMDEGDIIRFEECIDGKWFKFNFKIHKIDKTKNGWRAEFKAPMATIIFKVEEKKNTCIFSHIETFGFIKSQNPFICNVIAPIFRKLLNPKYRFDLIEKDIIEDNINLKRILEKGNNK